MFIKGVLSGIYKITCIPSKKIYIGSAVDIFDRWSVHKHYLRKNEHKNPYLQKAWNKYCEQNFKFEIIEKINKNIIIKREIFWIDKLSTRNRKYGFNIIEPQVPPMSGRLHSKKSKLKMRKAHKGKKLTEEHKKNMSLSRIGTKSTEETKIKMSIASKGKKKSKLAIENWKKTNKGINIGDKNPKAFLNKEIVKEIRKEYNEYLTNLKPKVKNKVIQYLCNKFGLKNCHVQKIVSKQIWRHI